MVLKKILGIDRLMSMLEAYRLSLTTIERNTRMIYEHQQKLQHQHMKLQDMSSSIYENTEFIKAQVEGLKKLEELLGIMEEKVKQNKDISGEIREARYYVSTMISETDKKYLEAIKNLKRVTANELAHFLGVKRGTTSAKLSELYQRNLLKKVREGRTVYYMINDTDKEDSEKEEKNDDMEEELVESESSDQQN